jgi:phage baseplate assembly protein W
MTTTFLNGAEALGRGIALPLQIEGGALGMNQGEAQVRQSILLILRTGHYERMMRPGFGGGMERLAFEPMNAVTGVLVQRLVKQALMQYEPRIEVLAVTTGATSELGVLQVEITYRIKQSGITGNLVYPFYLQTGA